MKALFLLCGAISVAVCTSQEKVTSANPVVKSIPILSENFYDMQPNISERLAVEIALPKCPWVKITEWRAPIGSSRGGPSKEAKNILGNACQTAVKSFPSFLKIHKLNVIFDSAKFHQTLCLMPIESNSRNLNDAFFRFRDREKTYDETGALNIIWGYTDFNSNTTFMRNDVINENGSINQKVVTIFTHELYHAMSWQFKVNDLYQNNSKTEEKMAQQFTQFLGLGI